MRANFFIMLLTIVVFALQALAAVAVERSEQPVERLVITGDKIQDNANYKILTRKDFINKAQTLNDILGQINGIQIRQISGIGNPAAVSIRGSSSKQVQLYIDGQLINDGQFGGFDLNQIPVEHIQSIEVSKDQAIGTGATPIGGVIRINTYNASQETLRLSASLGSFGTRELNATKNMTFSKGNFSIAASHLASDNDYDFLVEQPVDNPSQSATQALKNNQFEKNTLSLNGELHHDSHKVRLNGQFSKQDKALPSYRNNAASNRSALNSDSTRFGLNYLYQPDQKSAISKWLEQVEIETYKDDVKEKYVDSIDGINIGLNRYVSDKFNLSLKPTLVIEQFTITPFLDLNSQEFTSHSFYNDVASTCNGISSCDITANLDRVIFGSRVDWQSKKSELSTHLLFTKLSDKSENRIINGVGVDKENDNSFSTGEIGISYGWQDYQLTASLSRGVRLPTLFELYGDRGLFKGNDNLDSEESDAVSIAVNYNNNHWTLNSAAYYKKLSNAIVVTYNSSGIGSYSNVSDSTIAGLELQAHYQVSASLSVNGSLNLIHSNNNSIFVAFDNKKLPGIYHQELSAKVNYAINKQWSVDLSTDYSQGLYFSLTNKVAGNTQGNGNTSDRWTTNLQANWRYQAYSLSLGVANLFDESYQDYANEPAQGRSFLIKFSFEE